MLGQTLKLTAVLTEKNAFFYWLVLEKSAGDVNAPSHGDAAALAATQSRLHVVKRCSVAFTAGKGKGHPCTGTEALYRPYDP